MEKASRVNLEDKSGAGVSDRQPAAVYSHVLATTATLLKPTVLDIALRLDHFSDVERGDLLHG